MTPSPVPTIVARVRAQSSMIGLVLVFGIVLAGTIAVVVLGAGAIEESQERVSQERTEKAMTQFDSKAALVALGSSNTQQVSFGADRRGSYDLEEDSGWLRVTIENQSSGNTTILLNETLGAVTTESANSTLAYQGGGVWRTAGEDSSVMLSPPEFHYRGDTLTLPVVTLSGESSLGDRASISHEKTIQEYPNATADLTNPVQNRKVTVTVQSEYYQGWGFYFETRTEGGVSYDHGNKRVNLTLIDTNGHRPITAGLGVFGGGSGEVEIKGGNWDDALASYNSTAYTGTSAPGSGDFAFGGDIVTNHDLKFSAQVGIDGNVTTSGSVEFATSGNNLDIKGYLAHGGNLTFNNASDSCSDFVTEWCNGNGSVESRDSIDAEVNDKIDTYESDSNNNNDENNCINAADGLRWETGGCGTEITLTAGNYFVNNSGFQASNSNYKLILNTTDGDIDIALDERTFQIQNAEVEVVGNGTVEVYSTKRYQIQNNAKLWNEGWDADQLWLYCSSTCDSTPLEVQNSDVNAVFYGPETSQTQIKESDFYGAVATGGQVQVETNSRIIFDTQLESQNVLSGPTLPSVSYLQVSVNRVRVS